MYVVKLRRKSLLTYLNSIKCISPKNKNAFWDVVRPLVSDKCRGRQNNIIVSSENGTIIMIKTLCTLFNGFFNGLSDNIGQRSKRNYEPY